MNSPEHDQIMIRSVNGADIVAYALYGLGYRPTDRLIVVAARAVGGAEPGCHRVELGAVVSCERPQTLSEVPQVGEVTRILNKSGTKMAFVVVAGADLDSVGSDSPGPRAIAEATVVFLEEHGVEVIDALLLGRTRFRSLRCTESCCPREGRAVADLFSSQVAASMVLTGRGLAASEQDLVADIVVSPDQAVAQRLRGYQGAALTPRQRRAAAADWLRLVDQEARRLEESLGAEGRSITRARLAPASAARWIKALHDDTFRDCVLSLMVAPTRSRAETLLSELAEGQAAAAAEVLNSPGPAAPLAQASVALLADLARRAPAGHRAPALTLLAWRAWWEGDGVRSRLLCEAAIRDCPGYRLALLVVSLLAQGVPPSWVKRRRG